MTADERSDLAVLTVRVLVRLRGSPGNSNPWGIDLTT